MRTTWLKDPQAIFTGNDSDARGGVVISGSTITELVRSGAEPEQTCDDVVDAGSLVLVPDLINTLTTSTKP